MKGQICDVLQKCKDSFTMCRCLLHNLHNFSITCAFMWACMWACACFYIYTEQLTIHIPMSMYLYIIYRNPYVLHIYRIIPIHIPMSVYLYIIYRNPYALHIYRIIPIHIPMSVYLYIIYRNPYALHIYRIIPIHIPMSVYLYIIYRNPYALHIYRITPHTRAYVCVLIHYIQKPISYKLAERTIRLVGH